MSLSSLVLLRDALRSKSTKDYYSTWPNINVMEIAASYIVCHIDFANNNLAYFLLQVFSIRANVLSALTATADIVNAAAAAALPTAATT